MQFTDENTYIKFQGPPNFVSIFDMLLQLFLFIVVSENERSQVIIRNNVI